MNAPHIHLLVNHAPIFALVFALPLLALAAYLRDAGVWRAAAFLVAIGAVSAGVALRTGQAAEHPLAEQIPLSEVLVHEHEERAEVATILAVVAGVLVPLAYWKRAIHPTAAIVSSTVVVMVASGAMAWTANAGGALRHAEELGLSPGLGGGETADPESPTSASGDNASRK